MSPAQRKALLAAILHCCCPRGSPGGSPPGGSPIEFPIPIDNCNNCPGPNPNPLFATVVACGRSRQFPLTWNQASNAWLGGTNVFADDQTSCPQTCNGVPRFPSACVWNASLQCQNGVMVAHASVGIFQHVFVAKTLTPDAFTCSPFFYHATGVTLAAEVNCNECVGSLVEITITAA